jgi:hypothetical protein
MTDLPPPPDALDEAASVVVDGVATDADHALVAAAPDGASRVDAHRRVAALLATPPPVPSDEAVEAALATALAAFDADDAGRQGSEGKAAVVPLTPVRRAGRAPRTRWIAPVAALAAALLLVVGIASALRPTNRSHPTAALSAPDTAARSQQALEQRADAAAPSAGGPQAAAGAAGAAAPSAPLDGGDVGAIKDPAALAQRIADALDGATVDASSVRAGAPTADVARCTSMATKVAPVPLGALRYRGTGVYQGARVVVLAFDHAQGPSRILVLLDAKTCDLVTDEDF